MPVNRAKDFLKYVLYFHTFLQELQMAPSIPILEINVPNLVQGLLRTCYLLIWVKLLIPFLVEYGAEKQRRRR